MGVRTNISLLQFVGITAAIVIAVSLLWPFVAPFYNRSLTATSQHMTPSGIILSLKDDNNTIVISYEQHYLGLKRNLSTWIPGYTLHFGLILVVALIAATPGLKACKRLKFISSACLVLFTIHIATILIMARVLASYGPGTLNLLNHPLQILLITIGCDFFPVLIWGTLSIRYWRRAR